MNVPQVSDVNALAVLSQSKTLLELQDNWSSLTQAERSIPSVLAKKETLKTTLK
jgi:hypothetical protein